MLIQKLSDIKREWQWYRKKPLLVQAVELKEDVEIQTLEGVLTAHPGDFLIQGINTEIYPCKREIFMKSYDLFDLSGNEK